MRKIRLKYPVKDIFGILCEVGGKVQHTQEEKPEWKPPHKINAAATEPQKAWRQFFRQATDYAKAAKADPQLWAFYLTEAEKQGRQPRILAIVDYLDGKNLLLK